VIMPITLLGSFRGDGLGEGELLKVEQVREEVDQPEQDEGDHRAKGADREGESGDPQQPGAGREIAFGKEAGTTRGFTVH
jgi:hypothetical protein